MGGEECNLDDYNNRPRTSEEDDRHQDFDIFDIQHKPRSSSSTCETDGKVLLLLARGISTFTPSSVPFLT